MINVNSYFDEKVKSLGFESDHGKATVGVMLPGTYEFGTSSKEEMKIVSGTLFAKLPGQSDYQAYGAGTSFNVAANVKFQVRAEQPVSYLCLYS